MTRTLTVKNLKGADTDTVVNIQESWLESEKGSQAVKDSVVAFRSRMRSGTACTKTRSEVSFTGAKPWRQKGTGRARVGSAASPIWVGGGVAFGPRPRSFAKRINKKVERLALRRSFTDRLSTGDVILVDDFQVSEPKTKLLVSILNDLQVGEDVLILVDEYTENLALAARNLPTVNLVRASSVNTYLMLLYKKIVITQAGLEALGRRLV